MNSPPTPRRHAGCPDQSSKASRPAPSGHRKDSPRLWAAAIALALFLPLATALAAGTEVIPWRPPDIGTFDPANPPGNLRDGDADAAPWLDYRAGFKTRWDGDTLTISSTGTDTISGHTDIRLPTDADSVLREHENGHDRLNRSEWEQHAKAKVDTAMVGFSKMKFTGEGVTDSLRKASAEKKALDEWTVRMKRALAAIAEQMDKLADKFDQLTDHGDSDSCGTAQGEAEAKAEHAKAPEAGEAPAQPDDSEQSSRVDDGDQIVFDDLSQRLVVTGPGLITEATDPLDPIIGRGSVQLDSLVFIGLKSNGMIWLADACLKILDTVSGDTLLNGYLLEVAYMPSLIPGYVGMIQGYLDIPPPWAHGICNMIGSEFLAGMQAASDAGKMTTMWVCTTTSLFDSLGNCTIPSAGAPIVSILGVSPTHPSAVNDTPGLGQARLRVFPQPAMRTVRFAWQPVAGLADLEIFDASGARRWATRVNAERGGWVWQGTDMNGQRLRPGIYFVRLHGRGWALTSRVVLLR